MLLLPAMPAAEVELGELLKGNWGGSGVGAGAGLGVGAFTGAPVMPTVCAWEPPTPNSKIEILAAEIKKVFAAFIKIPKVPSFFFHFTCHGLVAPR